MSSIEQETGKAVSVEAVLPVLVKTFASVFEFSEIKESDRAKIESSSGESACHQPKQ
jgi:hypothetical protein